jgi:hypothetical protein
VPVYMTEEDLGNPVALSFNTTGDHGRLALDVQRLAKVWGIPASNRQVGRRDWLRAWQNIAVLANRLFDTLGTKEQCDPETFHHLLLAVGNFKRQAGVIHLPVDFADPVAGSRRESLVLPAGLGRLERDSVASWQRLNKIPGLGSIPTASCLLAALWPDSHAIMDVLDRRAAVGLQVGRRSRTDQHLDTARIPSHEWWFYNWFRRTVTLTAEAADCEPVSVERALYILGSRTASELGKKWKTNGTWSDYYHVALRQVDRGGKLAQAAGTTDASGL